MDYTSKLSLSFPGVDEVEQNIQTPGIEINDTTNDEAHVGPLKVFGFAHNLGMKFAIWGLEMCGEMFGDPHRSAPFFHPTKNQVNPRYCCGNATCTVTTRCE